jgi:hypothetical protein
MDYNQILRQMDKASTGSYSFAPPAAPVTARAGIQFQGDIRFAGPDIGSRNDANAVQATPKTTPVKHYVVIDTSQRNWVLQPNPYSNLIYSFGMTSLNGYSPPVYSNNPFVPTFGTDSNGVLNTQPGKPNTTGWRLPATGIASYVDYPAYNSSLPKGNFLAYDTGYTVNPSGLGFGSVFLPSNVQSIRLVRALLPQRQFLGVPILVNSNATAYDLSNFGPTGSVQSNLVNTPHSTFATYPYLLFNLNEYYGKYVGGNEAMRRAFSVMTQKTRTQNSFASAALGVQHYDYEPWNEEALILQSPITNLNQLKITITDPIGNPFTHNDGLNITLIQTDSNGLFLKCITGTNQYFSSNDLRVGDRVVFDPVTLSNIIKSPLYSGNVDKVSFANALATSSFPVLQLLDYVKDNTGQYVARISNSTTNTLRQSSYVASFNGFMIPNFLTTSLDGSVTQTYSNAPDAVIYSIFSFPIQYNFNPAQFSSNLPFMNTSLQPTYTLELTCLEPDTASLGGHITQ